MILMNSVTLLYCVVLAVRRRCLKGDEMLRQTVEYWLVLAAISLKVAVNSIF